MLSKRFLGISLLMLLAALAGNAQTAINLGMPHPQAKWPTVTGAGTPSSLSVPCSSINYGMPFQNTSIVPNPRYHCATDGWELDGGSGGGVTSIVPGTNVTCSPFASGKCIGDVTVNAAGSGGGISLQQQVVPPDSNQGVMIYPAGACTVSNSNPSIGSGTCNNQAGGIVTEPGGPLDHNIVVTLTWGSYVLPGYISPSNVTAVYGISLNTYSGTDTATGNPLAVSCTGTGSLQSNPPMTQMDSLSGSITGSNIATATCTAQINESVYMNYGTSNIPLIGLWVEYFGSAPPADTAVQVVPSLYYNSLTNQLGLPVMFPNGVYPIKVAVLPSAVMAPGAVYAVSDANAVSGTCTGGGSNALLCQSNGSTWNVFTGGVSSASNSDGTLVLSPTTGNVIASLNLTHANSWLATQTFSDIIDLGTAPVSGTNCLQIDSGGHVTNTGSACGSGGGGGTPGGSSGQYNYNGAGSFAGTSYTYVAQSGDTISTIESKCSGNPITYVVGIPQTLTLSANHALNSCVHLKFEANGLWTVNGAFTLSNLQIDSSSELTQHFAGSSTVTFAPTVKRPPVEWFGSVGYSTQAAAVAGTDSTASIQACLNAVTGQCSLQALFYKDTGTLYITSSNVGLAGPVFGSTQLGTSLVAQPAVIVMTGAGVDILHIDGSSAPGSAILFNHLENVTVQRSVAPTGTAVGILLRHAFGPTLDRVTSQDSYQDYYLDSVAGYGVGAISHSVAVNGQNGFTYTSDNYGWYMSGGLASMTFDYDIASNGNPSGNRYGMYLAGGSTTSDLFVDWFETYREHIGFFNATTMQDVHVENMINDSDDKCMSINGINSPGSATFAGGWCYGNNFGAVITNADGVTISGKTFYAQGITTVGSTNLHLIANRLYNMSTNRGIAIDTTTHSVVSQNILTANGGIAFNVTGSSYNAMTDNEINGTASTGMSFDSASNHNHYANINSIDPTSIGTPLSDAGVDNQLSGGGGGAAWGGITGTLSSQTDLAAALALLAPKNSPVITGVGDASGATQFKLPVSSTFSTAANGEIGYDNTNGNWHGFDFGSDSIFLMFPAGSPPTSGHCAEFMLTSDSWTLADTGSACGSGGGGAAWGGITGTLSSQTDLQAALNAKAAAPSNSTAPTTSWSILGGTTYDATCPSLPCTATLPSSIVTGFGAVIINKGAVDVTIAAAGGGPSYTGVITLPPGVSLGLYTNGTIFLSSQPITSYTGCTLTPSVTGSTLACSGGSGGFPFTIIQNTVINLAAGTSFTYTFPQALQSSGSTALLILGVDGNSAFTAPSGWTCPLNVTHGTDYARLVVCLKASAGDTSVSFSNAGSVTPNGRFYELAGSHTFDQYSSGSSSAAGVIDFPAITPTAGAAVFSVGTSIVNGSNVVPPQLPIGNPAWMPLDVFSSYSYNRLIFGSVYTQPATNASTLPPEVVIYPGLYSGGGLAWATFSIK